MAAELNAVLVKNGLRSVEAAQGLQAFVEVFYQRLFERHPEIRHMFPTDLRLQSIKMAESINLLANGIGELDMLRHPLQELGREHEEIGITPGMYSYVIESALYALEQTSNQQITADELAAWKVALEDLCDIMLSGYSRPAAVSRTASQTPAARTMPKD